MGPLGAISLLQSESRLCDHREHQLPYGFGHRLAPRLHVAEAADEAIPENRREPHIPSRRLVSQLPRPTMSELR